MRLALALVLLAAGCGPLVQIGGNAPAPDMLLTLRAPDAPASTSVATGVPLIVALPTVPGALRTLRIPVTTQATEVAYLKQANWIEQPNLLFQRLLADVVQARSGRPVLDERAAGSGAAQRLSGRLVEFGLDVRGDRVVRVRYDALLTGGDGTVASHRFEATAPVAAETGPDVARALNGAAIAVADEVAAWVTSRS